MTCQLGPVGRGRSPLRAGLEDRFRIVVEVRHNRRVVVTARRKELVVVGHSLAVVGIGLVEVHRRVLVGEKVRRMVLVVEGKESVPEADMGADCSPGVDNLTWELVVVVDCSLAVVEGKASLVVVDMEMQKADRSCPL